MAAPISEATAGLGFALVYHTMVVAAAQTAPVLAPLAAMELGVDARDVGLFTALVFAVALVSSTGTAGLLARFGSFAGAAGSLALAAAGVVAIALAGGVAGLMLGAVLIGVAYGPVNPVGSRIVSRVTAARRSNLMFSLKQSSVAIGAAATAAILPALTLAIGWRGAAGFAALSCLAAAAVAWPACARLGGDGDPSASVRFAWPWRSAATLLRDPAQRGLAAAVFAFSVAQFGFMSVYVTMIWQAAEVSPEIAAAMLSVAMATSIVGRLFWGWRADAGRPRRVLAGLAWSGAGTLTLMLLISPGWPIAALIAASAMLGLGPLSWSGVLLSEVARAGARRGGAQGVVVSTAGSMVFAYGGGLVGPALLSLSATVAGHYGPGVALMAVGFAASALVVGRDPHLQENST